MCFGGYDDRKIQKHKKGGWQYCNRGHKLKRLQRPAIEPQERLPEAREDAVAQTVRQQGGDRGAD